MIDINHQHSEVGPQRPLGKSRWRKPKASVLKLQPPPLEQVREPGASNFHPSVKPEGTFVQDQLTSFPPLNSFFRVFRGLLMGSWKYVAAS